jgi:hypothetical protein
MRMVNIKCQSLYLQAKNPSNDWIGDWVGPIGGMDVLEYIYIFCPCRDSDLGSLVFINPLTPELNTSAQRCLTIFLVGILFLEPCISLIRGVWRSEIPTHHVTRHNTPIHNILSTAPQLSISQKAVGTLPEDGNVMPNHVGDTIHN